MTKIETILKTMQAVLLVTVFTPVPSFAEPALTARQMLAQAQIQSQDNAAKSEAKKITGSELIMTDAQAVEPTKPNLPLPVVTATFSAPSAPVSPATAVVAKVDTPAPTPSTTEKESTASFEVATTPVTPAAETPVATSSIVLLPGPPLAADTIPPESVTKTDTITSAVATVAIPASAVQTRSSATEAAMPAPASRLPVVAATNGTANDAPTADNAVGATVGNAKRKAVSSGETAATRSSSRRPRRPHPYSIYEIGNANIGTHVQHILNRPEVRSLLAQYGVN